MANQPYVVFITESVTKIYVIEAESQEQAVEKANYQGMPAAYVHKQPNKTQVATLGDYTNGPLRDY